MIKRITSLSIAGALTLCALANPAYAANNKETAKKIAAIFAEEKENAQQKLNLEASKRQKLENENKALLEEVQKLKADKENKALLEEVQKLKAEKEKKVLLEEVQKLNAENENKILLEEMQKLKAEKENKVLLEEVQKLKAEKGNKELQQEIEKLKTSMKKTSNPSAKPINGARGVLRLILGASGIGVIAAAGAYVIEIIKAKSECSKDRRCKSYREKIDKSYIFDLTTWHNLLTGVYNIASISKRFLDDWER